MLAILLIQKQSHRSMATRAPSSRGAVTLDGPRIKPTPPIPIVASSGNGNGSSDQSLVTSQRRYLAMMNRYSLAKLTASTLVQEINNFHAGTLRAFAQRMESIEQKDDVLMSVIPKREAAVKRMKWQVLVNEDVPVEDKETADEHRKALFHFYNNLTCTHAMDANLKGGFSTFVELAMKCVGYKWSAFETIWKPETEGLTAEFSFVPLRFFENTTGELRFLPSDFASYGDALQPNGWVVFCGPCLLEPCAANYLIKDLARTSYLIYCQNQGMPGIVGKTKAAYLGEQWNAFNTALGELLAGNTLLMGEGDEVSKLDLSATGQLPFPALIEEQNQRMATLWRGGSLGTVGTSTGPEQRGVVLQADEEGKLAADDGQRISDTLNQTIDKLVIEWTFGEGVKPLAYVKIAPPATIDVDRDIKTFEFLASKGVELGKQQLREHFSVSEPGDGDEIVNPAQPEAGFDEQGNPLPPQPRTGATGEPMVEDEATPEEVKAELEAKLAEAGNEKATRADLLKALNTPRNACALNVLLRSGELKP